MNTEELKPCPFCGGTGKVYVKRGYHGYEPDIYGVKCIVCGASVELTHGYVNLSNAVRTKWNRRIT